MSPRTRSPLRRDPPAWRAIDLRTQLRAFTLLPILAVLVAPAVWRIEILTAAAFGGALALAIPFGIGRLLGITV